MKRGLRGTFAGCRLVGAGGRAELGGLAVSQTSRTGIPRAGALHPGLCPRAYAWGLCGKQEETKLCLLKSSESVTGCIWEDLEILEARNTEIRN